ncbi:hypothetical protein B8V81_4772 [Paenibacillus pasadenensis]|uniref:Uncharacterized protein n=1 Tax=Paenibacillus pasadenensis TaxID=217090 RepID=A0A2N5N7L9_9BACL|nr:hypothetical protein B8V81_4772 [Paenibacillus pasadenensis]
MRERAFPLFAAVPPIAEKARESPFRSGFRIVPCSRTDYRLE